MSDLLTQAGLKSASCSSGAEPPRTKEDVHMCRAFFFFLYGIMMHCGIYMKAFLSHFVFRMSVN